MKYFLGILCVVVIIWSAQSVWAETAPPRVRFETSKGDILLELNENAAPKTVENFLSYVRNGFFDGTIFHRVIKGFMIQGGGLTEDLKKKPTQPPVQNEADNGLLNLRGTIAMARTNDPHSATSQFFINTVTNDFLDHSAKTARGWGYCVFGKVVEGMDVVDVIEKVKTSSKAGRSDVPVEPIIIQKAVIVEE
ncbi:peptidylprolyl isomerase [candidate division KSB3 bacterium]|uniref:Peptidyl-prolyl cis-trans isomerase n=1 Tax=candidate division KSB3 bacterium TaxID=2044937 RepID=A0A2G6KF91_9BACT|nr:MAG: peptidylprolyl isomerase [candidate division KSB3 bacterium]